MTVQRATCFGVIALVVCVCLCVCLYLLFFVFVLSTYRAHWNALTFLLANWLCWLCIMIKTKRYFFFCVCFVRSCHVCQVSWPTNYCFRHHLHKLESVFIEGRLLVWNLDFAHVGWRGLFCIRNLVACVIILIFDNIIPTVVVSKLAFFNYLPWAQCMQITLQLIHVNSWLCWFFFSSVWRQISH
jgi:hypothetical protein